MNRRDFLGSVAATAAVGEIVKMPLPIGANVRSPLPRAKWLENGLIDAGGSHEPYLFVVRRGGESQEARQEYEANQSEQLIRTLQEQGIEVFHTHLYKGFGMAAEKPEMEDTRRAAAIAHRYGMKVDTYIQWNTMMYETFFAEEPRAQQWIQREASGLPILLTYGYQQSYRYRPCFTHQEYLDYLKKIVRYAVEEVKTDFIHFDNFDLSAEPDSCHCAACVEGFRAFLRAKYTPEKRRERFGFENVGLRQSSAVEPPESAGENGDHFRSRHPGMDRFPLPGDGRRLAPDGGVRALAQSRRWRLKSTRTASRGATAPGKRCRPRAPADLDRSLLDGGRQSLRVQRGRPPDFARSAATSWRAPTTTCCWRTLRITPWPWPSAWHSTRPSASREMRPCRPPCSSTWRFTAAIVTSSWAAADVAPVGVLRSYASLTYHHARAQLAPSWWSRPSSSRACRFSLYLTSLFPTSRNSRCWCCPIPNASRTSSWRGFALTSSRAAGWWPLVMPGCTTSGGGCAGEPGLKGLVDAQPHARDYEENVEESAAGGEAQRKTYGRGRVAYFPALPFDGPLPAPEAYFNISNRFWKRPRNWEEVIAAIRWATNTDLPLEVSGPPFLAANLVEQDARERRLIHLVNYDARKTASISSLRCVVRVPAGKTAKGVALYKVQGKAPRPLAFEAGASSATFILPEMGTYAVIAVSW